MSLVILIFRYFLNAYKKYKSYYPVRYKKNRNTFVLNNISHKSVGTNLSQYLKSNTLSMFYYSIIY